MDPSRDPNQNAAWQAARQWQERARQARPTQKASGFRLLLTWLAFGVMMIIGTVIGLFLLLVGWALMPFARRRMKKRMEQMRANNAQDIGSGSYSHSDRSSPHQQGATEFLEGDYEVKPDDHPRS